MNVRILRAILAKDATSLAPLLLLAALLFLADAILVRLNVLPAWTSYNVPVLLVALIAVVIPLFQLDSPASLTDDWLCRPVPKRELVVAKLGLLTATVYLPRAIGALGADLFLGYPVSESVLDALFLEEGLLPFLLPMLLFTAVVTRTFVQAFGVLFALFICVFVLPTPFVRPPGPLDPGIRDALFFSGVQWLATTPAKLASLLLLAAGFWLAYWRRRLVASRLLMATTVCVTLLFLLLPMALIPWSATFAVQKAVAPAPAAHPQAVYLRHTRACFPAARRAALATDAAFVAASRRSQLTLWTDEELPGVGPESVAFLTRVEPRGLPLDWRVKLNHVKADFRVGGVVRHSLRPARYITDHGGHGMLAHAWMLPEDALLDLQRSQPQFELTYSLTLLAPRTHALPTDGLRHELPGLGYCSARVEGAGNRIAVGCFSVLSSAAQISAELTDVPATRTFGHSRADFAPRWLKWPYGHRVELSIDSARLARHDHVTVTAWEAAGHLDESLSSPGILGAPTTTCPLPAAEGVFQRARWRDSAPHEIVSIGVDEGVQVEVLDFGGDGVPLLLLPGLGATAHSYDELAPKLARSHRVVAMTRRGSGASSKPDFGYDTPRLARDVLEVMNAMKLQQVVPIGHSIAGDELTWLGGNHPERFSGLIYLDAAYDRSRESPRQTSHYRELTRRLPPEPPIPPEALLNYAAMSRLLEVRGHARYPEGELIAFFGVTDPDLAGSPGVEARVQQAISAALGPPDYARVKIPALAIYAIDSTDQPLPPWYDANDAALRATVAELSRIREAKRRQNIERFRAEVVAGQVLEMRNATHSIIHSNEAEVLLVIERFVDALERR